MKVALLALLLNIGLFAADTHVATITETLNSAGYTYMKVQEGKNSYWIAMTQRDVKVGQKISFNEQGWMKDFKSKTLNRTFDNILFASDTQTQANKLADIKPNIMTSKYKQTDTITIAELFKNRDKYVGKTVTVRGNVRKTSSGIMKRNWIHIEDGSRFQNMDDLVFTSPNEIVKEGTIVSATGTLVKDKDFGYGYFYPVIIEKSTFK